MTHIIDTISRNRKVLIKKATSAQSYDVYGNDVITYGDEEEISGIIYSSAAGEYDKNLETNDGVLEKSQYYLFVKIDETVPLQSKIKDEWITDDVYVIVEQSDQLKHYEAALENVANYKEFKLRKLNQVDW